jgi:hypothetical protein
MPPGGVSDAIQAASAYALLVIVTLMAQWLMESFFYPSTRKKLPGKHGQQDLIAAPATTAPNI